MGVSTLKKWGGGGGGGGHGPPGPPVPMPMLLGNNDETYGAIYEVIQANSGASVNDPVPIAAVYYFSY